MLVESQTSPDSNKRWVWPAYLALARAEHRCPAVLIVVCPGRDVGTWARQPISTGHPGFQLVPVVVDAVNTPVAPLSDGAGAAPELAVLACLTGAVDLDDDEQRRAVLSVVAAAHLDEDQLETYTHLIRAAASPAARQALETLMTTTFKDEWIDRIKAEGKAEGKAEQAAQMLLRLLAVRGFDVSTSVRDRVLASTNLGELEAWVDRAIAAASIDEVFTI